MPSLDSIDANAVNKFLGKLTIENICSSLLILIICIILIKLVTRLLRRILKHTPLDDRLKKFLLTGVRVVLYVITVIIVAQSLGVPTTSLIALMSVGAFGSFPRRAGNAFQCCRRYDAFNFPPHYIG